MERKRKVFLLELHTGKLLGFMPPFPSSNQEVMGSLSFHEDFRLHLVMAIVRASGVDLATVGISLHKF